MKELCKKQFSKLVSDDGRREKRMFKGIVFNVIRRKIFGNHKMKTFDLEIRINLQYFIKQSTLLSSTLCDMYNACKTM